MAGDELKVVRGFSSKASPLPQDLLKADTREVPAGLLATGTYPSADKTIALNRYCSPEFAQLEKEKLWKKVWQFACREEDIPNVGDRIPYTVGDLSFMIVRSGPSSFRAFYNTCLHRGTRLCDGMSSGESVRCPFHAWEWNLDGSLKNIPSRWDFPKVDSEKYRLPDVKCETWGGFIFVNPDPDAAPLSKALGVLPEHFASFNPAERFTAFHIRKKVRANWKITMEAFLESYHVVETHTESLGFTGDASTQYDVWDDGASHISRLITPSAIPSPHLGDHASVADAVNQAFQAFALAMPGVPVPQYDPASRLNGRAQVAEWRRQMMGAGLGRDFSNVSDATMIDSIQYYMFPNFCPWFGEGLPLVYQFLPHGDNPNESIMSVRLTVPVPGGGAPRPPSAPIREIDFDERFDAVPEIGLLAIIFDQDMGNLPRVQAGLRGAEPGHAFATLGRYQEQRIRHFHDVLDRTLEA